MDDFGELSPELHLRACWHRRASPRRFAFSFVSLL
jgi:hypothetical protein